MSFDVIVIGAGVAGLACARVLARAGKRVRVLERSRGVGGRCATRRLGDGQAVDHGVAFLHGTAASFLAAIDASPGEKIEGWPWVVEGQGTPCQPRAFSPTERRVAFVAGVSAFPKSLAVGLDVVAGVTVTGVGLGDDELVVRASIDSAVVGFAARDVVLALAAPQSSALLRTLPASREVAAALALSSLVPSVPCATVIATYGRDVAPPDWQMLNPSDFGALHLVSHDSSKRRDPAQLALVLQARAAWSRAHADDPDDALASALLADAARHVGTWVGGPTNLQVHRWKYARSAGEAGLASPVVLGLGRRCRVGLAGELYAAPGGVEAAFLSGERLAHRLLEQVTQ